VNTKQSNPSHQRRTVAKLLALTVIAGLGCVGVAQAQSYPSKPITLVVPYPAGGANDMLGRLIGQKLSEGLGQPVIIDNKPGAGTLIGANIVAKAAPDGYTLLVGGFASNAVSPLLFKAEYDPVTAFEPIGMFGTAPTVVITYPASPYKTIKDVVDAAKAKPGVLMYGSSGNGSPLHMSGEMFTAQAGINMIHVPYKGGSAHILDLIGGRLDVIFDTSTNASKLIKGEKVRAIAVSSKSRLPDLPDVPTLTEAGYPDFSVNGWYALYAPAKTPKEIVSRLSSELQKVLKQADVIEKLRAVGVTPGTGDQQELAKYGPAELEKYGKLIKAANIKAD
jgi:tripartite-type tricarboxylate transporter receptor subunit TctC